MVRLCDTICHREIACMSQVNLKNHKIRTFVKSKNKHLALLERHEVGLPDGAVVPTDDEINSIANQDEDPAIKAVEKLGYVPPTVKLQRTEREAKIVEMRKQQQNATLPLAKALRGVGVKPFTEESVRRYQWKMLQNPLQITKLDPDSTANVGFIGISGLLINVLLFGYASLAATFLFEIPSVTLAPMAIAPVCLLIAVLMYGLIKESCSQRLEKVLEPAVVLITLLSFGSTFCFLHIFGPRGLVWRTRNLSGYDQDIPHPIISTIAEIHAYCPGARFEIEELVNKPDPFIVVKLGAEKYHIEVWNEAKFDGTRAA